jgi:hypothetical protein
MPISGSPGPLLFVYSARHLAHLVCARLCGFAAPPPLHSSPAARWPSAQRRPRQPTDSQPPARLTVACFTFRSHSVAQVPPRQGSCPRRPRLIPASLPARRIQELDGAMLFDDTMFPLARRTKKQFSQRPLAMAESRRRRRNRRLLGCQPASTTAAISTQIGTQPCSARRAVSTDDPTVPALHTGGGKQLASGR